MKKALVAATAAALIAGSAMAITAQAQQPGGGPRTDATARQRMSAEDVAAFSDARIAALKAGLKLTPEQEKNWPALEAALRDSAKARADRMAKMREERQTSQERPNVIERMRLRADMMTTGAADLKKIADAADPLYKSLDDAQKRRFSVLMRPGGGRAMGMRMHHAGHGPGGQRPAQ